MRLRLLALILFLGLLPSCTIVRVDSAQGPPGVKFGGIVEGHAAMGWLANDTPLEIKILDGSQNQALFEFKLWKLLRLELGLAGASIGLGPLHLGLGALGYDAHRPAMIGDDEQSPEPVAEDEHGDDED